MTDPALVDAHVGAALRAARLSRGLRQDDLAEQMGVDRSTIARYERGTRSMSVSTLLQAAHLLDRPATIFLPGIYASADLQSILALLERRPDILPRLLDLLLANLRDDAAGSDSVGATPDRRALGRSAG
ncbi:MAG: helix-turn-helix transcriptional regulator [Chloroflexales bacterium]